MPNFTATIHPSSIKKAVNMTAQPEFWFQTYSNIATLTSYMADNGMDAREVADAVEKPWKYTEVFEDAIAEFESEKNAS